MIGLALYHCECRAERKQPLQDATSAPTAEYEYWPLQSLYFCEECDAIKCSECVTEEVSVYYCPLCLFEVPTASVRAEQHRCARNCFQCPCCDHFLSVVAEEAASSAATPPVPSEQPAANSGASFLLLCQNCRWDSKEIGLTFEKSTGLAAQLQKSEALSAASIEFDRVRDHLHGHVGANSQHAQAAAQAHVNATKTPAISSRSSSLLALGSRSRSLATLRPKVAPTPRDEMDAYVPTSTALDCAASEANRVEIITNLASLDDVASLEKRAHLPCDQSVLLSRHKPLRVPLQAKRTKRCPDCKHIIVKPDSKATSTKFRIKLVASNYLPAIQVFKRPPVSVGSRISAANSASLSRKGGRSSLAPGRSDVEEPLRQGRAYSFELAFVNPLYEPIFVKVSAHNAPSTAAEAVSHPSNFPYTLHLPATSFSIDAFAEQWEYEDALADADYADGMDIDNPQAKRSASSRRRGQVGVLEKKANRTTILLDVNIGKEAIGQIKAYLLVTYIYSADQLPATDATKRSKGTDETATEDLKSFSFWAQLNLGSVLPLSSAALAKSRIVSTTSANAEGPANPSGPAEN